MVSQILHFSAPGYHSLLFISFKKKMSKKKWLTILDATGYFVKLGASDGIGAITTNRFTLTRIFTNWRI
jgi:hypothetical protein